MARRMHGLAGIKEDAMELLAVGGGAVVGIAAAKAVTGYLSDMDWAKKPGADGKTPAWAPYAIAAVPVAVGVGVIFAANKANLQGNARKAAVSVAAGMTAVAIGKIVVAAAPETAKSLYLNGLGADSYDTGLLAGLGEVDATVAAYMQRPGLMGGPISADTLTTFAGAPILVSSEADRTIGAPTIAQPLSGAPLSATLM